jgi:hypothetical protein
VGGVGVSDDGPTRRAVLRATVATSAAVGLAGCSINLGTDPDDGNDEPTPDEDTPTESRTPTAFRTPSFDQDCLDHDLDAIEVEEDGSGGYRIVDGDSILLAFDTFDNAKRARDVIQHYGFTQHCFVGRPDPSMSYWLLDGAPPVRDDGGMASEDCIELDPGAIEIQENGSGGYQIVKRDSILLGFDTYENAKRAHDAIQHYGFTQYCFVGRPDPPMTYWLVDEV